MAPDSGTQAEVVAFLSDPATYGTDSPVEIIGTHISQVFLAGNRAYKLKRAVRLPYADFSTPRIRHQTCRKELDLNRETAPSLYLAVRRITRAGDGGLEFDGDGPLVDAVVEMARFDQADLFDALARGEGLTSACMAGLAGSVAAFHAAAPRANGTGGAARMAAVLDINRAGFETSDVFTAGEITALDDAMRRALAAHANALDKRAKAGFVRRCHGDLHLRNICMFEGRPTLFDCIDFNDEIATVDTLYDLAFLLMDLWHRDLQALANLVANRYFDAIRADEGYDLLPFFMAVRAQVRAHVTATASMNGGPRAARRAELAREYYSLAAALLRERPGRMVAIGGYSGSGKTTVAEALAPRLGNPPGARIVESDRTRKAMYGVAPEQILPAEAYAAEVSDKVYELMRARVLVLADQGASVVADAVFGHKDRRRSFQAALPGVPVRGFWLAAPAETLRRRVETREKGASDATVDVLEGQLKRGTGVMEWTELPAEAAPEALAEIILAAINGKP